MLSPHSQSPLIPPAKNYLVLLIADALAVAGGLALYFFFPPSDTATIAAYAGTVAAGLFVVIPWIIDSLRPSTAPRALQLLRQENADNQAHLQSDLRALADTLLKRLNLLEKHLLAQPAPALPSALGELADQVAALAPLSGEDGEIARLRAQLEEIQAQLDALAESLRAGEISSAPPPTETDGPLPPSLMAKAFSSAPAGGAISRLIGNSLRAEETPPTADHPDLAEDEVWHAATEMAEEETTRPAAPSQPARLPKTTPRQMDENQTELLLEGFSAAPKSSVTENAAKEKPVDAHASVLIASIQIGIGNKPFVRGTGPGLSPDIGVPMEYVSVGRWRWVSPDPSQPAQITLWKNDILRADGDPVELPPHSAVEIIPHFPGE